MSILRVSFLIVLYEYKEAVRHLFSHGHELFLRSLTYGYLNVFQKLSKINISTHKQILK